MKQEIEAYARSCDLDFFDTIFEILDYDRMNEVAAYGGFPSRYPHWRHGMEYEQLSKSYEYGLSKIYEMVLNNDPCYAYLLRSNNMIDQKMVMAHVFGHADFFKNNRYFKETNRKMIDVMGNHRARIGRYINRFGMERVEALIDRCLSIENLINIHRPGQRWKSHQRSRLLEGESAEGARQRKEDQTLREPERDILWYLIEHAPLENWEREILVMIREEQYYFSPQGATKILNEGWAAYWHSRIMTTRALTDADLIDYASHHASTVSPQAGRLNPYKIGMELLRDIEKRWDRKKIFEVRALHNDLTFLDEFLTPDFCREQKFFIYGFNQANGTYEIIDREFQKVKEKLLMSLTNLGHPIVEAVSGNYGGHGELHLKHLHEGIDLRLDWAKETSKNLYDLWKKPIHLETLVEGIPKILSYDGEEHREHRMT
jgi:stage V sporulation protein R